MAKYIVTSPEGEKFEITAPDNATEAEVQAFAEKNYKAPPANSSANESFGTFVGRGVDSLVSGAKATGSRFADLGRGALKAYGGATELAKKVTPNNPVLQALLNLGPAISGTGNLALAEKLIPTPEGDPFSRQMERSFIEGAGGALALGPGFAMQAPKAALVSGGIGNVAADLTQRAGNNAGVPEQVTDIASTLAGMLVGGGAAYAFGPRQNASDARIRDALKTTPPADWLKAWENRRLLADTQTGTMAEAFPGRNPIKALAEETAAGAGGGQLASRLVGRDQEMQDLGTLTADRLGPRTSPAQTANAVAEAATGARNLVGRTASDTLGNRLLGQNIRPGQTAEIYRYLQGLASSTRRTELADAYREVADQLLAQGGNSFLTSVQDLSLSLKGLKDRPVGEAGSSGRKINSNDLAAAIREAEQALAQRSPAFREGMGDFQAFHQQVGGPLKEGIIGASAVNPNIPKPAPKAVLNNFLTGQTADDVAGAARMLQNPNLTGGPTVDPLQIAQALIRAKTEKGSLNPGQSVRGMPGSQQDQNLQALIDAGGIDPQQALRPLAQADLMAGNYKRPPGTTGDAPIASISALIRVRRFLDFLANKGDRENYYREISKLLTDPSPENLQALRERAMFDPEIRRRLTMASALNPAMQQEGN
jgi:hypothetical protein